MNSRKQIYRANSGNLKGFATKITVLLFIICIAWSCQKDFFDLERPPQNPWSTLSEFERVPIGLYASLFGGDAWNIAWVNAWMVKNNAGDDVSWVNDPSFGYWRQSKEVNVYSGRAVVGLYRAVAGANHALEFVNGNNGNPYPEISAADSINNLNRIKGEIYFCRGYAYYLLQTTYGHAYVPGGPNSTRDIPMPLKYAKSAAEAKNPAIATTQEVWDQIVSDLVKAKELLPEKYVASTMHSSYAVRANKFAASAMLMRAYFQRGEYDKALAECSFIIENNNGEYNLTEDPIEAYNKSSLSRGREVIFYAPYYDQNLLPGAQHLTVANHTYQNNGMTIWAEAHLAQNVIKRIGWMNDPQTDTSFTVNALRDKRFRQLMAVRYPRLKARPNAPVDPRSDINNITTVWTHKYYRGSGLLYTNVPLIRLAEVYLTRSVIRLRANNKAGAAEDLNVVRKRAWDETVGGPFVPVNAADITESMIGDERIIEMFAEGDRIDYLRGLKVDVPPGDRAEQRGYKPVPYTSEDFVWALPEGEYLYNESLP